MPQRKMILLVLLRFVGVYALLIFPWPGFREAYSRYYQGLGNAIFSGGEGPRWICFEPNRERVWPANFDTLIVMTNRDKLDAMGNGPQIRLGLDTRQMGWIPGALFVALTAAAPMRLKRRLQVAGGGAVLTQAYIVFSLWVFIGNESTRLSLVTFAPTWKRLAQAVETAVIDNPVGPNLLVPVVIFLVLAFRAGEMGFLPATRKN